MQVAWLRTYLALGLGAVAVALLALARWVAPRRELAARVLGREGADAGDVDGASA